ncbi:MAG: hypothetical protein RIR18_762 [Pseudomonadota bacterium]|jgi:hypothetical protein
MSDPSNGELRQLLLAQDETLNTIRQELMALRKEVAELKIGRQQGRAKAQSVSTPAPKAVLSNREISKMMFVSWASRQSLAFDSESSEARQRRLLPEFESSNNCRVINVDRLR